MFACLSSKHTRMFEKKRHKNSYLTSPPNTQFLSGSLFSTRVLELHRCEHFGEDGLRDTTGLYFRGSIFPLAVGKPVLCQTVWSYELSSRCRSTSSKRKASIFHDKRQDNLFCCCTGYAAVFVCHCVLSGVNCLH